MKAWVARIAGVCVLCAGGAAHAWGIDGHRVAGAMADQLIRGTHAEQQVRALLLPGESLEKAAVWMDCAKGGSPATAPAACGQPTADMLEYTAANPLHAEYHYANLPFQSQQYQQGAAGAGSHDIVQSMRQAVWVLQGKDGAAVNPHRFSKRQALLLLAHLAGDIHQPLHVGNAYLDGKGAFVMPLRPEQVDGIAMTSSAGGNALLLEGGRSLHNYWDYTLVEYAMRRMGAQSPQQYAQGVLAARPAVAEIDGDPAEWAPLLAAESLEVARRAHAGVKAGPMQQVATKESPVSWQVTVPEDYAVTASGIVKEQLTRAGYRLAAILQAIWP